MSRKKENNKIMEGAEYGVDSRYPSHEERTTDGKALIKARKQRMANLSNEEIVTARLLQLKYRMEEYIKKPINNNCDSFAEFLKSYIDTIYSKRIHFAEDIDVKPVLLSQVNPIYTPYPY